MSTIYQESDAALLKPDGRNLVTIGRALNWEARWDTAKRVVTLRSPVQPSKMIRVPVTSINNDRVRSTVHQLTTYSDPARVQELVDDGVDLTRITATKTKAPREYATTVAQAMSDAQEAANPPEPEPVWPKSKPRNDIALGHWTELLFADGHKEWVCDKVDEHKDGKPKTVHTKMAISGHNNAHREISEEEKAIYRANIAKARAIYLEKHGRKPTWDVKREQEAAAEQGHTGVAVPPWEIPTASPKARARVAESIARLEERPGVLLEDVVPPPAAETLAQIVALVAPNVTALETAVAALTEDRDRWKRKAEEIEAEWDALRAMIGSK